jgi:hypothetical protein
MGLRGRVGDGVEGEGAGMGLEGEGEGLRLKVVESASHKR